MAGHIMAHMANSTYDEMVSSEYFFIEENH